MTNEISVIMSVYAEPLEWISKSIESILNQTFNDFEFIIVNDNPNSENHKNLLRKYANKDSRIKLIENKINNGLTKSLNIALRETQSKYVARMDADDISMPLRLQIQYDFMESHPEVDVCGTWVRAFGDIALFADKRLIMPVTNTEIKIQSLIYSPMIHPSAFFRMTRLPKVMYNENYKKAQDYVLWGELIKQGFVFRNIPDYLLKYRVTKKSQKINYKSQQFSSADKTREILLQSLLPKSDGNSIGIHNLVCNEQICNIDDSERWLIKLRELLIESFPKESQFINSIIKRLWININLTNRSSFRRFCKSSLKGTVSALDFLRFVKRCKL